jgi:nucleotide-binding universal stress UspA family protein
MFSKILHANDGSEHAFHAFSWALALAEQNGSELHMVCVEEINYLPEFIEEVREDTKTAARRFHPAIQRARAMADERRIKLHTHLVAGHPVRDIVNLAAELEVSLLVIGAKGHSAVYERIIGSPSRSYNAARTLSGPDSEVNADRLDLRSLARGMHS